MVTGFVSISTFASSFVIFISIRSFAVGLEICAITAGINKYKSMIEKKRRKHDKIVLFTKIKLTSMEVLYFRVLVKSCVKRI